MKKYIALSSVFIMLSSCFWNQPALKTGLEGKPLPSFDLLLTDSVTHLNTGNISTGVPIVLFYFSPSCPYCKAQTKDMIENIKSLSGINIYFLSDYSIQSLKSFSQQFQLDKHRNVFIGQDVDKYFGNYFNTPGVPYTAIYGKDKLLKRVFVGKIGANLIKDIAIE